MLILIWPIAVNKNGYDAFPRLLVIISLEPLLVLLKDMVQKFPMVELIEPHIVDLFRLNYRWQCYKFRWFTCQNAREKTNTMLISPALTSILIGLKVYSTFSICAIIYEVNDSSQVEIILVFLA